MNAPETPPAEVVKMQGVWKWNASFNLRYDSLWYSCYGTSDSIIIGSVLNSAWPYQFNAILKGLKLHCFLDNSPQWEVILDSLQIDVWRAMLILGIQFKVPTPFGELAMDCEAAWHPDEIAVDTCGGDVFVDLPSTLVTVDGTGKWTLSRSH